MSAAPRAPSLQGHLVRLVLGLVGALWVAATALGWVTARHELDELLDGHLAQAAALLVVQTVEPEDDPAAPVPALHKYARRAAFQVWHDGRLVLRSSEAPERPLSGLDPSAPPLQGHVDVSIDGRDWRVFGTVSPGGSVVLVGDLRRARREILTAVIVSALGPPLLVLPLLAGGTWWAVRRGLSPLRRLGAQVARRDPRSLQPLRAADAPPGEVAELRPLTDALDGLLARMADLLEKERRFTADAAHELRTPIAAIRAQAQAAMALHDEPGRRQALAGTLAGCDRAAHLVGQLLQLSRLEAQGEAAVHPVRDLAALARQQAALLAGQWPQRSDDLLLEADAPVPVAGDEALLGVLVRNLLDNALRYSPPGRPVRVQVARAADGAATLAVEDGGPGLEPEHLARLGERFFRLPGQDQPGSGLGWSIVRRIAAAHGAQLRAGPSEALGGLAVSVRFPPVLSADAAR
jgi:two-component system sensor histidine kinase QseC